MKKALFTAVLAMVGCGQPSFQEIPCRPGLESCACFDDGTCNAGLSCDRDENICQGLAPTSGGDDDGGGDDGPVGCDPTDPSTYSGTSAAYTCGFGLVSFDISSWTFAPQGVNLSVTASTSTFGALTGAMPECPGGSFTVSKALAGGCCETYTLSATFTGDDTWEGTFVAQFCESPSCGCSGGDGYSCSNLGFDPCTNQSFAIDGAR
jgi:hypothetical protein